MSTTYYMIRGRYESERDDPANGAELYATREDAMHAIDGHLRIFGGYGPLPTVIEVSGRLGALADARSARPGRCGLDGCRASATRWYRTSLTPAGTRAVRACEAHAALVYGLLHQLTMEDCVRLATRGQVRRARQLAAAAAQRSDAYARESAALAGASSLTHTYALLAGAAEAESARQVAFAAAVASLDGTDEH